jgi:hypothetical protein
LNEEPDTEELRRLQSDREAQEQEMARKAADEHETAQHERRADKARYLKEKLKERADSEREAEDER